VMNQELPSNNEVIMSEGAKVIRLDLVKDISRYLRAGSVGVVRHQNFSNLLSETY
jgi:hypothetical protein